MRVQGGHDSNDLRGQGGHHSEGLGFGVSKDGAGRELAWFNIWGSGFRVWGLPNMSVGSTFRTPRRLQNEERTA